MNQALLFFSLFFPRISLFFAYLNGAIPPNSLPFFIEFLLTLFLPRALIIFYAGTTLGWESPWVFIHVFGWIVAWFFGISSTSKKSS